MLLVLHKTILELLDHQREVHWKAQRHARSLRLRYWKQGLEIQGDLFLFYLHPWPLKLPICTPCLACEQDTQDTGQDSASSVYQL